MAMVTTAIENLNTFWVVGVVEQYRGFVEVLKRSMDPDQKHEELWEHAVDVKNNGWVSVLLLLCVQLCKHCLNVSWQIVDSRVMSGGRCN